MGQGPYDVSKSRMPPKQGFASVAHATVTETAILRRKVADLEKLIAQQTQLVGDQAREIEELRRQVKALRDGVVLDSEP